MKQEVTPTIGVEDITSQITTNANLLSGTVSVYKYGKVVTVTAEGVKANTRNVIATGLPKSACRGGGVCEAAGQVHGAFWITKGSTELGCNNDGTAMYGSMAYLCE